MKTHVRKLDRNTPKPHDTSRDQAGYVIRDSKSQKKRESHQLIVLGEALVDAKPHETERLNIPDDVREAIDEARKIHAHGGHKRQLQYLGRLIRSWHEESPDAVNALLHWQSNAYHLQLQQAKITSATLRWTQNLLREGRTLAQGGESTMLERFAELYPHAPLDQISDHIIVGQSQSGQGKRARRLLATLINQAINPTPPPS